MFRPTTSAVVLLLALVRASAEPPTPLSLVERDLQRLNAAVEDLARRGDRTESRRPLAGILDELSRDAAELDRAQRTAPPDRRRAVEKLERDAAQASRAEREFWKGAGATRPALSGDVVAELRATNAQLARDLDDKSLSGGTRPAASVAQTADFQARERAAQAQAQAARARAQAGLRNPWEETPRAGASASNTTAAAGSGACPQCNAESRPVNDLRAAAVPAPEVKTPPQSGFWGSVGALYDRAAGAVHGAYDKAVFAKQKMEEATGPVVSGILEGVADTAAGITLGALLWALGKLLAQLGLGALLSEVGVGEAIIALRLRQIMLAVGVVLTAVQVVATVAALRRWIAAKPGSPESTNALREFVRSTTGLVLALALAVIGIRGGRKPGAPPEPGTPPANVHGALVEGTPPAAEPPSKLTPPTPPPEPVEPAPVQPGQGPTIKVNRDVGRHYFDDGVIGRRGDGIKMAHSRAKFEQTLSGEGRIISDTPVPGFKGMSMVEYKLFKLDVRGNRLPELKETSMFKTVVDEKEWTDDRVSALARALFGRLPHQVPTSGRVSATYTVYVTRGSVRFIGWVDRATGTLTSFGVDRVGP